MSDWTYQATVVSVYDGDTIVVDIDMGMKVWQKGIRIRFAGINAPELNTGEGKVSRDALKTQISPGDIVTVISHSFEKYGRLLATVEKNNINLNQWMLDNNFAVPYM